MGVKMWGFGIKIRELHIIGKNEKDTKIFHNPVALIYNIIRGVSLLYNFLTLHRHIFVILFFLYPRKYCGGGGVFRSKCVVRAVATNVTCRVISPVR